jgi:molybdopterin-containing oxidoreductase family membrane subunit
MNIVIIVTGGMVTVAYAVEYFIGWYSGSRYEDFTYLSQVQPVLIGGHSGR